MNCPIPVSNPDSSAAADPSGRQLVIHVKNAVERYQQILELGLPKGLPKGLSTGFSLLDKMCHGLEPGRIYLIASRPGLGKTTLLLNIIAAVCLNQKTPALFFSGELTIPQIVDRLIFSRALAPLSAFVGLLHKEGPPSDEDCVNLLIAKNNNGPVGTVRLFFSGELQRFDQDPVVYHEENEMERAWRDYRLDKDFPREMA